MPLTTFATMSTMPAILPAASRRATVYPESTPCKSPALAGVLLLAALAPFSMGTAAAASFNLSANSSTAQTLGSGSGQTGTVAAGKTLSVSGSGNAVAITGNNAVLTNLGTIRQTGTGRVVRDNTGVTGLVINNGAAGNGDALMQSADADVIQMNVSPASVTLNNYGTMTSLNASKGGAQAVDFNAIQSGANSINNYGTLQASEADAVRPGVNGALYNAGTIRSTTGTGSSSDGIDAQNNSGIVIVNDVTGLVDGARHGITGGPATASGNFTMSITNHAGGIIRGNNGAGLNLDGFNSREVITVVNHGLISGNGITGDGDGVDVDGLVNLNNTGIIRSVNAFSPAGSGLAYSEGISVGGGVIVNSGTIEGLVSAGNRNAVGRGITLAGNDISSGPLAGTREGLYGNATITNQAGGLIRGQNDSAIVTVGAASGYTVTINNQAGATIRGGGVGSIGGNGSAAIVTGADNTVIVNGGAIDGASNGKAIAMGSGLNTLTIVGGAASVSGGIDGGSGSGNKMVVDAGAGNSFGYAGSIAHFSSVEIRSGQVTLSGASAYTGATLLTGGKLTLDGANRIDAASALALGGGTLQLINTGGANGQTFASLSLTDNSAIALGLSSLTFNGLGTVLAGKTLTLSDYAAASSGAYAFRVRGDYSTDSSFLALIGGTTIDGRAAAFRYDGVYTDVTAAVPEPGTYAMLLAGLGLMGAVVRRRRAS